MGCLPARSETMSRGAGCGNSACPDLWGAGVGNCPGLPDRYDSGIVRSRSEFFDTSWGPRSLAAPSWEGVCPKGVIHGFSTGPAHSPSDSSQQPFSVPDCTSSLPQQHPHFSYAYNLEQRIPRLLSSGG
jgi:hypothetical protein